MDRKWATISSAFWIPLRDIPKALSLVRPAMVALLLAGILNGPSLQAQSAEKKGDEAYELGYYKLALEHYKDALEQDSKKLSVKERIARCYHELRRYKDAEEQYAAIYDQEGVQPRTILEYGHVLRNNEKYEKAAEVYEKYIAVKPGDPRGSFYKEASSFALENAEPDPETKVKRLPLETGGVSLGTALYGDGLIFSQRDPKEVGEDPEEAEKDEKKDPDARSYYDLAYVEKKGSIAYEVYLDRSGNVRPRLKDLKARNAAFGTPRAIKGDVNTGFHDGGPSLTADGQTLFYTSNASEKAFYKRKNREKRGISKGGENVLKIYKAERDGEKWKRARSLPFNSVEYNCAHPTITPEGDTMFFVSDMEGGHGGYDIYRVTKTENGWSEAENLGSDINTREDEQFPFYDERTGKLYFASYAHFNYGGFDIFEAERNEGGNWGNVQNMGKPINSSRDDFAFLMKADGKSGYFSSNRKGEGDRDHLYAFKMLDLSDTATGIVMNQVSSEPIEDARLQIVNQSNGRTIMDTTSNADGAYGSVVFDFDEPYMIKVSADGYKDRLIEVPPRDRKAILEEMKELGLKPIPKKDQVFRIDNIYFDYDKATLKDSSKLVLDKVLGFLEDNPKTRIELSAHTDSRGGKAYNRKLSQKRAQSCVDYLASKGIDRGRLKAVGYGESKLVNHCADGVECSEEQHQRNRRVEVKILDEGDGGEAAATE